MAAQKPSLLADKPAAEASGVAARLTPVPGSVGPMTIAMLMANTLAAARLARR